MFNKIAKQECNWTRRRSSRFATGLLSTWMAVMALTAVGRVSAETVTKGDFTFVNAVDTSQGVFTLRICARDQQRGCPRLQVCGKWFRTGECVEMAERQTYSHCV